MAMPLTLTSTVSPATIGPTPPGVPVAITSPGSRVITAVIQRMTTSIGKIISPTVAYCFTWPLTRVSTFVAAFGGCVSSTGP